jgi:Protein of unknown function (DUF1761)
MDINVNWIAIILAAVSTMVVGSIWYSPKMFYKQWARLANVKHDPNFTTNKAIILYGQAFLTSVVTAIVLAYAIAAFHLVSDDSYLLDAIFVGAVLWVGFVAARFHMHDLFEGRRKKLTLLNTTHELVTIIVMAVIIGLMPV